MMMGMSGGSPDRGNIGIISGMAVHEITPAPPACPGTLRPLCGWQNSIGATKFTRACQIYMNGTRE
jgi:hypothetical protein